MGVFDISELHKSIYERRNIPEIKSPQLALSVAIARAPAVNDFNIASPRTSSLFTLTSKRGSQGSLKYRLSSRFVRSS